MEIKDIQLQLIYVMLQENNIKLQVKYTNSFEKDLKLAKKQNKKLDKLFYIIEKLANLEKLEDKYHDHELIGNYKGFRECHIEPDWLLIYYINNNSITLVLSRLGSHSDLFEQGKIFTKFYFLNF